MKNELKTYTIYQVYIRNFNKEGTIKSLIKQLDYIKNLGIKIIQLLPVNEIGLDGRKGVLGSPYAIKDYYKINPELGNKEDFDNLIFEAHKRDLLVMMDVVFNHTSRDSVLIKEHPEFYYKDKDGHYANHFGDWSDVYDLDYTNIALHEYITKVLEYYTNLGIDGYRFDVASLLPNEFYKFAFPRIKKINPNIILLAEAIEPEFSSYIRENKGNADCDCELYLDGFDLLYRYSNYSFLKEYLVSNNLKYLDSYRTTLSLENSLYPNDALKIGTIENHDCPRIASFTNYDPYRENIIAFSFFLKGTGFIFNGEESKAFKLPDLFNKDPINLDIVDSNYFNFVKKMISLKANKDNLELIQTNCLESSGPIIYLKNIFKNTAPIYGIFNFSDNPQSFKSKDLIDGTYINLINNEKIIVKNNTLKINQPLYLAKLSDNIVY